MVRNNQVDNRWNPLARFVEADQLLVDIRLLCELFLSVSSLLPIIPDILSNSSYNYISPMN